jgi:hypothetical protein
VRTQIAYNFENISLIWGMLSLLTTYFRFFHSRLSDSDSLESRKLDANPPPTPALALLYFGKTQIYLNRAKKSANLHEDICHIIISDMYKPKTNRKHCSAPVAELSISITLLTATCGCEQYKQEALSSVRVDNGDLNVPICLLPVTLVSNIL